MYDFDTIAPRRGVNSCKYIGIADDLTAMSVADMDFIVPEEIRSALHRRIDNTNYG